MNIFRSTLFILLFSAVCTSSSHASAVSGFYQADSVISIPDTLLFKMENAQAAIAKINSSNKGSFETAAIRTELNELNSSLVPIRNDLALPDKITDSKTLSSYQLLLNDAQKKLEAWRTSLSKINNELQQRSQQIVAMSSDSILQVNTGDTTQKKLYSRQLLDLRLRLQESGKSTTANLDTVSQLLADVSSSYFIVTDLQNTISEKLKETGKSLIRKESPYIWAAPGRVKTDVADLIRSSYKGQNKILSYFINSTWDNRITLLLVSLAFFYWVYRNFKKAKELTLRGKLEAVKFDYISFRPVFATIIVCLNLVPLFEPDSPSLYIELTQFLLLGFLTWHIWKKIPPSQFRSWIVIVLLYIVVVLTNVIIDGSLLLRLWLVALNLASLYIGSRFYKKLEEAKFNKRFIRPVLIIYLSLNFLSVAFNVLGRISLAKVHTITAIIGLTQIIGLAALIRILTDAMELQIKVSSSTGGLFSRIDLAKTRVSFRKVLSVIAVILWLLVFAINLGIANDTMALIKEILSKQRTFGSISFTLGNIMFFAVIVYLANLLQKHIGILFGERKVTFTSQNEHRSSKLALIRLVIIIIGTLLAIMASGIPIDKLTVVLGALSVGIGLGMQTIVNNFVSGIILIFEKPFRIGDYVELVDKKGKVKSIGIRASKLLTPQGSEVIIPNGDLLSGRLVNWTLTTEYVKSEVLVKVGIDSDLESVNKIITQEISKSNDTIKNIPPEILVNAIAADNIELKVLVWVNNIYVEPAFRSMLLGRLLLRFKEAEVKIM